MHSFGMSEHYVVLAEYPLVADVQAIAARKRPFIENYEWLPDRGTIFTVVSKADGTVVARAQGEPFLGIHQINCFERDGAIVFDVPAYPEGRHIRNLYLDRRAAAEALETSQIKRYTVPLNGRDVTSEILFDEFAELPTIDYARDAAAVLRSLREPAVVCGHSLGALVAGVVAAQLPERVRAVVLEDPPAPSVL